MNTQNIEAELRQFESQLRDKAGLNKQKTHWHDAGLKTDNPFNKSTDTILFGGLTHIHDQLIQASAQRQGLKVKALPTPDLAALQTGKEFGNRGQCNPTHFTVGNLVQYLQWLRDEEGVPHQDIIQNYLFVTPATCGPCRFGMYITEYRKALRDAGFAGFRVMSFQTGKAVEHDPMAFHVSKKLIIAMLKANVIGDVLTAQGYRMRPYEIEKGSTDKALQQALEIISRTLCQGKSIGKALRQARSCLQAVKVNWLQVKPKVSIIGEFWAMTTEGDGNYKLQRFLEQEGAECEVQPVTVWFLYLIWAAKAQHAEQSRAYRKKGLGKRLIFYSAEKLLSGYFKHIARKLALVHYPLTDMNKLAQISEPYYPTMLRGGEGHMEIGKVISSFTHKKHHLVISVKPFGCMPSSAVSDGIQPLLSTHYPQANFLSVETSGDSSVNVYSRVQMALFRAKKSAEAEYEEAIKQYHRNNEEKKSSVTFEPYPAHYVAGTATNTIKCYWNKNR